MSIVDAFDPATEAVIAPSRMAAAGYPDTAVVCFSEKMMDVFRAHYAAEEIDARYGGQRIPVYRVEYRGKALAVYRTLPGGAFSVALMEEMAANGCRRFVFFGSCGALEADIAAAGLVVPTAAYRDEGTSYHYMPAGEDYVEVATAPALAARLAALGLPFIQGRVWTTDAFYRETRGNMAKRRAEGCVAVEMECASIMAAAGFRGLEVYQFLYAADCLAGAAWDPRILGGKLPEDARARYWQVALEIARGVDA